VPEVTITHLSGSKKEKSQTFRDFPVTIGRAPDCMVRFDAEVDRKVSAHHAELRESADGGLEVLDLGSTNGVILNGQRVDHQAAIATLSTLEIGAGGPRLRIRVERGTTGISFSKLRGETSDAGPVQHGRPVPQTEEVPVVTEADLASLDKDGQGDQRLVIVAAAGGFVVLVAILYLVFS
jgi:FHA domain